MDNTVECPRQKWTQRWKKYSLQELIELNLPIMGILTLLLVAVTFVFRNEMEFLIYSALPPTWKNFLTLIACTVLDLWFVAMILAVSAEILQLHAILFDVLIHNVLLVGSNATRALTYDQLLSNVRSLRCLQMYVLLLNVVNRYVLFMFKLSAIFLAVTNGYAAVAHFHRHPLLGLMNFIVFVDISLCYCLIYQKAFQVLQKFEDVVCQLYVCLRRSRYLQFRGLAKKILERQLRSIPKFGVKVGEFHTLERAATPNFVDFVFKNIVNLLVIYG